MKKLFLLLFLTEICISTGLQAETASETTVQPTAGQYPCVLPPSPEASTLCKYTEFPVSYFYGLPQINIPLYELTYNDLTVPISISYHGGGIKATELSGRVGLGWALNAGGCISRSVCGYPDEVLINVGNSAPPANPEMLDIRIRGYHRLTNRDFELLEFIQNKKYSYEPNFHSTDHILNVLHPQNRFYQEYEGGYLDATPDRYSFNFLGYSGVFILTDEHHAVLQTDSPVELVDIRFPSYFSMRDKKGILYYFDEPEYSYHPYKSCSPDIGPTDIQNDTIKYVSSWHLSKIVTPQNDIIRFTYTENKKYDIESGVFASRTRADISVPDYDNYYSSYLNTNNIPYRKISVSPKRLDRIIAEDAVVTFITDNTVPREDIPEDHTRLDKLYVQNMQEEYIKRYNFTYSYFRSFKNKTKFALCLDRIDEEALDENGNGRQRLYEFGYYGNHDMPWYKDYSAGIDHWGYNNEYPATIHIPKFSHPGYNQGKGEGANREPSPSYPLYGTLTDITYPTGGSVHFTWEPHTYSSESFTPIKPYMTEAVYDTILTTLCGLGNFGPNDVISSSIHVDESEKTPKISIDLSKYYYLYIDEIKTTNGCELKNDHNFTAPGTYDNSNVPFISIKKNGIETNRVYVDLPAVEKKPNGFDIELKEGGYYTLELHNPHADFPERLRQDYNRECSPYILYGKIHISYIKQIKAPQKMHMKQGGGLRIKKINANFFDRTVTKNFIYEDGLYSRGNLPAYIDYFSESFALILSVEGEQVPEVCYRLATQSTSGLYNTIQGEPKIEYQKVDEVYGDIGNKDFRTLPRITHYFNSGRDTEDEGENGTFYLNPLQPAANRFFTSNAHKRGNLVKQEYWDPQQPDSIVKTVEYEYSVKEDPVAHWFSAGMFATADFRLAGLGVIVEETVKDENGKDKVINVKKSPTKDYFSSNFKLQPYKKLLKMKRETEYRGGDNPVTNTVRYTYPYENLERDYNLYLMKLPLSEERERSDRNYEVVYYSYLMPANGSFCDKVETEVRTVNGYIVEAKRMVYDPQTLLLLRTYTADISSPVPASGFDLGKTPRASDALTAFINVPEFEYQYFQNKISQISYKGEILASFLWAYKGAHPVAEIKRKSAQETDNILEAIGTSRNRLFYLSDIGNWLNKLRDRLPENEMTTLLYYPSIGPVSETDVRGITTTYEYDPYGRLKNIRDYNSYFIKKYEYNLKP
ncbi:MAG: RHS repeat domain-containing protein [Barnesiella sp.]